MGSGPGVATLPCHHFRLSLERHVRTSALARPQHHATQRDTCEADSPAVLSLPGLTVSFHLVRHCKMSRNAGNLSMAEAAAPAVVVAVIQESLRHRVPAATMVCKLPDGQQSAYTWSAGALH